jgi:hypothetical protein
MPTNSLLDRVAVVTVITPVGRNIKLNLQSIRPMRRMAGWDKANWRGWSLFYIPDKIRLVSVIRPDKTEAVKNSRRECPAQMTAPAPGVPHHAWF